jgi:hypothetical protein
MDRLNAVNTHSSDTGVQLDFPLTSPNPWLNCFLNLILRCRNVTTLLFHFALYFVCQVPCSVQSCFDLLCLLGAELIEFCRDHCSRFSLKNDE